LQLHERELLIEVQDVPFKEVAQPSLLPLTKIAGDQLLALQEALLVPLKFLRQHLIGLLYIAGCDQGSSDIERIQVLYLLVDLLKQLLIDC